MFRLFRRKLADEKTEQKELAGREERLVLALRRGDVVGAHHVLENVNRLPASFVDAHVQEINQIDAETHKISLELRELTETIATKEKRLRELSARKAMLQPSFDNQEQNLFCVAVECLPAGVERIEFLRKLIFRKHFSLQDMTGNQRRLATINSHPNEMGLLLLASHPSFLELTVATQAFLGLKQRNQECPFLEYYNGLTKAFFFCAAVKRAQIKSLMDLVKTGHIEPDTKDPVGRVLELLSRFPGDLQNLMLQLIIGAPVDSQRVQGGRTDDSFLICKDTVNVWMLCDVLSKDETSNSAMIHYQHWGDRWNETLRLDDFSRVLEWVHPLHGASLRNDRLENVFYSEWKLRWMNKYL